MAHIDLSHLCKLAQLKLSEDEERAVLRDLEQIIDMVGQMQAVDTEGVTPLASPLDGRQRLRADRVTEEIDRERFQELSAATEDGLYLVPRVVE